MFYIQVSNGLLKGDHRKRMGEAVWEFMWCIDKITKIDEDGIGWVLGGKPINLKDLSGDMGFHFTTVSRNLNKLQKFGYLGLVHTPYGIRISINKAKKVFKKNRGNVVDKSEDKKNRFSVSAKRFNTNAKPNKIASPVTEYKYSSSGGNKNFEPINAEGRKKVEELKKKLTIKSI